MGVVDLPYLRIPALDGRLNIPYRGLVDATGKPLGKVDDSTNASTMITYPHHEVHGGSAYTVHVTNTTANTNAHRSAIGFTTPNTTKWGHLTITIAASDPADFTVLEAPTIDDDAGGNMPIYNRNRNSANTSVMLSLESPGVAARATTYTEAQIAAANFSGGTTLDTVVLATGSNPQAVGGAARGEEEWVLKQNTDYIFLFTNTAQNANTHSISLNWYEHTDAN